MPGRIRVQVLAADPVSEAGVASQLRYRTELEVVAAATTPETQPDVVVVVADEVDEERLRAVRSRAAGGPLPRGPGRQRARRAGRAQRGRGRRFRHRPAS